MIVVQVHTLEKTQNPHLRLSTQSDPHKIRQKKQNIRLQPPKASLKIIKILSAQNKTKEAILDTKMSKLKRKWRYRSKKQKKKWLDAF